MILCSYRASACKAVLPSCMAFYVISVRQTRDLPVVSLFPHPASFRFHLTMDTLAFGYILPTTGRIRDLHPLETCAAGRTLEKERQKKPFFFCEKTAICTLLISESNPLITLEKIIEISYLDALNSLKTTGGNKYDCK